MRVKEEEGMCHGYPKIIGGRKQSWLYLHLISLPNLDKQKKKTHKVFSICLVSQTIIWV